MRALATQSRFMPGPAGFSLEKELLMNPLPIVQARRFVKCAPRRIRLRYGNGSENQAPEIPVDPPQTFYLSSASQFVQPNQKGKIYG
jgi:hypothetical protein